MPNLGAVRLSAEETVRLMHGQAVMLDNEPPVGRVRLYDEAGQFLGIGESLDGAVKPRRLWVRGRSE
mgnify:CR=1 FL=1